jgi:hypothetical protein
MTRNRLLLKKFCPFLPQATFHEHVVSSQRQERQDPNLRQFEGQLSRLVVALSSDCANIQVQRRFDRGTWGFLPTAVADEDESEFEDAARKLTEQWPSGQAHLIVKALLRRFRPRDATSELEFSQALMQLQLGQGEDSSTLFTQIAHLSNRYRIHNYPEQQVTEVSYGHRRRV